MALTVLRLLSCCTSWIQPQNCRPVDRNIMRTLPSMCCCIFKWYVFIVPLWILFRVWILHLITWLISLNSTKNNTKLLLKAFVAKQQITSLITSHLNVYEKRKKLLCFSQLVLERPLCFFPMLVVCCFFFCFVRSTIWYINFTLTQRPIQFDSKIC